jgi:integrase
MQASEAARVWAKTAGRETARAAGLPRTVRQALLAYRADKITAGQNARAGDVATLLRRHVPVALAEILIAELTAEGLRLWVAGLRNVRSEHRRGERRLSQHRVDGLCGVMKAALHAAKTDPEVLRDGLGAHTTAAATGGVRSAPVARKLILERSQLDALLAAVKSIDIDLWRFCRVLDVTGARPSQVARLRADDVDVERNLLLIPRSAKGRPGSRKTDVIDFPLDNTAHLAELRDGADPATLLLLHRPHRFQEAGKVGSWHVDGRVGWSKNTWTRPFREAVAAAGLSATITIYAFRHSRIVAFLREGLPAQLVAVIMDTSEPMLRRHYARWIGQHASAQALIRAALARENGHAGVAT